MAPADAVQPNVVQVEMRLLEQTLAIALHGIGVGDLRPIGPALHRLHEAKGATERALEEGAYLPPLRGDLRAFTAFDEAFHAELEELYAASERGDVPAAAVAFGRVLTQCQGCHVTFRGPPAPATGSSP